jgi:hypothetical protein
MLLTRFTSNEMVHVTKPWITPGDPANQIIHSKPLLVGVLSTLTQAYEWLQTLLPDTRSTQDGELSQRAADLDQRHDILARVMFALFSALALLARDTARVQELLAILLPEGLSHTLHSYRSESGHIKTVEAKLTAEDWQYLAAVKFDDTDMAAIVREWIEVGTELGKVETERARTRQPDSPGPSNVNDARLNWIRCVNGLMAMADLAQLTEEEDHLLFNELRIVEKGAQARVQRSKTDEVSDAVASDTPAPPSDVSPTSTDATTSSESAAPSEAPASTESARSDDTVAPGGPEISTGPPSSPAEETER